MYDSQLKEDVDMWQKKPQTNNITGNWKLKDITFYDA